MKEHFGWGDSARQWQDFRAATDRFLKTLPDIYKFVIIECDDQSFSVRIHPDQNILMAQLYIQKIDAFTEGYIATLKSRQGKRYQISACINGRHALEKSDIIEDGLLEIGETLGVGGITYQLSTNTVFHNGKPCGYIFDTENE